MMKKTWIIVASLLGLMLACSKNEAEIETPKNDVIVTYIKADGNEDASKASVSNSDASFSWNTGDKVAVYANGYKISDALGSAYNGTNTATFAFSGDNAVTEANRANFAIFPASLVWDGSAIRSGSATDYTSTSLKLTLPASYTLEEVQNEVSPTPMIAVNTADGDLSFKALCPLLRITVENIPKQTKRIEFDFNGKKVQGEFTLTSVAAGTTAIATSATDGTDDIITVTMADNTTWHDYLVVNLPVPAGTYGDITITTYEEDGHRLIYKKQPIKQTAAWEPTRKSSRKMTATLPVFTAANGKKVTFAPDNLYAEITAVDGSGVPTAAEWHFGSPTQSATQSFTVGSKIDLFGWSSNGTYYGINSSVDPALYYADGTFIDWGNNVIDDYPAGTWRTPSIEDWNSLTGNDRIGMVIGGILLVPEEGFIDPKQNDNMYSSGDFVNYSRAWDWVGAGYIEENVPIDWIETNLYFNDDRIQSMKDAGAVFLQLNNYRFRLGNTNYDYDLGDTDKCQFWFHSSQVCPRDSEYPDSYLCHVFWIDYKDWLTDLFFEEHITECGYYVRLIRDLN